MRLLQILKDTIDMEVYDCLLAGLGFKEDEVFAIGHEEILREDRQTYDVAEDM